VNVNFMNPFLEAAVEVLKAECALQVTRGGISLHKSAMTTDDVTILVSLVGQIQGVVLYGLSKSTSLGLVSRVMGYSFDQFDNIAQSGVAELGNVITGQATIKLSGAGYNTNISPPTLIQGRGVSISTLDFSRIVAPLETESGIIMVHLALRESPSGSSGSQRTARTVASPSAHTPVRLSSKDASS